MELNRGWWLGYGVVVEAIVGTTLVGTNDGLASMITVRVLAAVSPYLNHDDVEAMDVSLLGSLRLAEVGRVE